MYNRRQPSEMLVQWPARVSLVLFRETVLWHGTFRGAVTRHELEETQPVRCSAKERPTHGTAAQEEL